MKTNSNPEILPKDLKSRGRVLTGKVIRKAMAKTVVVEVERVKRVPLYGKYIRVRKKYLAHDEHGEFEVGDKVKIRESRPISKRKHRVVIGKI